MLLLIAISFLFKWYGTQAIPLPAPFATSATFKGPNFTRDDASDGCNGRTVLDILWSCLATTFACTWVSVHPNVPFKGEGEWTLRFRRVFLMFFSILAPEFMIVWAFKQWRGAVMIREAVNKAILEASADKEMPVRTLWTTTHGHLLQMGGFRLSATARENFLWGESTDTVKRPEYPLDVNNDNPLSVYLSRTRRMFKPETLLDRERETSMPVHKSPIPGQVHHRHETSQGPWTTGYTHDNKPMDDVWEGVLTFDALKRHLSENLITFPTITEDEINDRSKGDALSKGIALLQLTWFIVQIIARAVQGLAITELELTTAALAGLNSVMYIFWWSKPRDVQTPVVIRTKGVEELLTKRIENVQVTWSFSDREFDIQEHLWTSMTSWIKALFVTPGNFVVSLPFQVISILLKSVGTVKTFPCRFIVFVSQIRSLLPRSRKITTSENEDDVPLAVDDERSPHKLGNRTKGYIFAMVNGARSAMTSSFVPFFCLLYIIDVVFFIPITQILGSDGKGSISGNVFNELGGFNVDTELGIFSMIFYSEDAGVDPLLCTSSIAGALFGAVHCLAWHFSFPTHAEQVMWRTASLGLVGSCCAIAYTVFVHMMYMKTKDFWETVTFCLRLVGVVLCFLASLIYPVARITLLVLSITSLRFLPPSAFDTVDWVDFVPHI